MNTVIQQGHITVYWLKETAKVFIVLQTWILDIAVPSNFVFNKVSWKIAASTKIAAQPFFNNDFHMHQRLFLSTKTEY